MIIKSSFSRKALACFFLVLLTVQGLMPTVAWALTSGPSQPETKQFLQAGTSDMVDLSTGDFKYNIPLLDVDGYPVNLNYLGGVGMDDEASWVGLGWNLNAGAINRQLRGIPDDSYGDEVVTNAYMKPKINIGGKVTVRGELLGLGLSGSVSLGIFSDNYTGIGAEIGANAGLSLTSSNQTSLSPGLNLGITSNTADGVSVTPSISLSLKHKMNDEASTSSSISANLGYNTREGLKGLSLGSSFSASGQNNYTTIVNHCQATEHNDRGGTSRNIGGSSISYNTPPFYPRTGIAFKSGNFTFSVDIGGEAIGMYMGGGVTGYKSRREVLNEEMKNKTFGFMYAEKGKDVRGAMMDFMREKDNPIIPELRNLALPIATPDLFSYSSQAGGGQFKLYRNSAGVFFDNETKDITDNTSIGSDYGWGAYFHGGVSLYNQDITSTNGKWTTDNNFLNHGDFAAVTTIEEPAYFKQVGEKNMENPSFVNRLQNESAVSVSLSDKRSNDEIKTASQRFFPSTESLKKDGRQPRRTPVMMLTAEQAVHSALDTQLHNYEFNKEANFSPVACNGVSTAERRITGIRKGKHISEMTVTGDDGKRMVYGLPVYNKKQDEYSYAVKITNQDISKNLIPFTTVNGKIDHKPLTAGVSTTDEYYHKESQPAYASAFLLTGILSPDYVDVTGDGITDDDRGTAIKFNYSKLKQDFHWRSPYGAFAQYNHALNADPDDDKASFVYGEKELWYIHSIETRTKIAYFITEDRDDALGCSWDGVKESTVKQKKLTRIVLYSKNDLSTPIKTVVLHYDNYLCSGVPNSSAAAGKLTLTGIHFEYGSSSKGKENPYTFKYNNGKSYGYLSTDRWGTFKPITDNDAIGFGAMKNDEFPYSTRDSVLASENAGMWNLKEIDLPTGGIINIKYESDDYAYVQNRRAMEMVKIDDLLDKDGNVTNSLRDARKFKLTLGESAPDFDQLNWFRRQYLNGEPYMYAKLFVNVTDDITATGADKFDYISCYGLVDAVVITGRTAVVTFKTTNEITAGANPFDRANPFISAAWQKMRLEYPRFAYPGYKNRISDDRPIAAAVTAIANATGNLAELRENFSAKAYRKKFASNVNLAKSFVRIVKRGTPEKPGVTPRNGDVPKLGGGTRVKSIQLSDNWNAMATDQASASYGQEYEYGMIEDNKWISSGVASYEPSIGGDENPMHLPVNYTQDVKWALNNVFYLEEPMGETLFPAPGVVYREVKVRSLDATGHPDETNKTGWLTYEFYTSKEFPVVIDQTPLDKYLHKPDTWSNFFGGKSVYELAMSQGYAITLNDMHGKPKADRIFNQKGYEISASEYYYNATEEGGIQRLKNMVDVVDDNGTITKDQIIGREIDMFTDMRQSETINSGKSINLGVDVIPMGPYIVPIPHYPVGKNEDYRLFRSASVLKTIQYYGVISKVVKKINGSNVSATNLLYDKFTGEPVLSRTNNEFDDPVYSLSMPAYWMYKQMGPAYKNLGLLLSDFTTTKEGLPEKGYGSFLTAGDELTDVNTGMRLWVVNSANVLRVIDASGRIAIQYAGKVKVRRSGYRNLLTSGTTSITSLKNPIVNSQLKAIINDYVDLKVLSASAIEYNDAWGQPADCNLKSCPEGYQEGPDGRCYLPATRSEDVSFHIIHGDRDPEYSNGGAFFFTENQNDVSNDRSTAAFWRGSAENNGRLSEAGVWMTGATDGIWWGFESCFDIPADGPYYIGFGADNIMSIYIDGQPFYALTAVDNESYYTNWRVRVKTMTKGKHIIQMNARNKGAKKSAAVEIYNSDYNTLKNGIANTINSQMIFTTAGLENNVNVKSFYGDGAGAITSASLSCPQGKILGLCDGTPNCGFKEKGACPEGYKPGADGMSCIPIAPAGETDVSSDLDFVPGSISQFYTANGTRFFSVNGTQESIINQTGSYFAPCKFTVTARAAVDSQQLAAKSMIAAVSDPAFPTCGLLSVKGVWLRGEFLNKWIGVHTCLKVPETKLYYIGLGFDNIGRVYIDGVKWNPPVTIPADLTFTVWPIQLTAGNHLLTIEARNFETERGFVVEVYNDSLPTLKQGIAHPIFSTGQLRNATAYYTYVKDTLGNMLRQSYSCPEGAFDVCGNSGTCGAIPNTVSLNPYLTGYLGNWLPWKQMAWLSNRTSQVLPVNSNTSPAVNIRQTGDYSYFYPYWVYNNGWAVSGIVTWVKSQTISLYDKYSQEVESKDALNRYSAARYGYKSTLPVAVGANMRQREIFYDGFDDYKFNNNCTGVASCEPDEFSIYKLLGATYADHLDETDAHSGNYSLNLDTELHLKTYVFSNEHEPGIYLTNNKKGEYFRNVASWLGLRGFCPVNGRRYVFSAWVKDGNPSAPDAKISLIINQSTTVELKKKAVVEDWKLVEGIIDIAALAGVAEMFEINAVLSKTGGKVLVDDIRIFPYDGQLKTFTYDDKTQRLMAELDENNYATLYEYDDEGSLVRVKKETERGIMTIKENRSAYRKK